jgi:Protein of unknown function (DUF3383)
MASNLPITLVISVSVSQAPLGIGAYNTSNLALFTTDTPALSFGTLGYQIYFSPNQIATDFGTSSNTYIMANEVFSQSPNILTGGGYLVIIPKLTGEMLDAAISRTLGLVSYFGVMSTIIESQSVMLAAAAVIQAQLLLGFFVQRSSGSIASGGSLDLLRSGSFTQSRGLYYGSSDDLSALTYQAGYAGRALSTNFNGSNTTSTMHLKSIAGCQPDPTMTPSIFALAQAAGADIYANFQNVACVFCSGTNSFFDQVYNSQWFVGAIQVAGFNFLRTSSTKIPQTEDGMDGLKSAYRLVCQQATTNGYFAPGTWTSGTTFGVQQDFVSNISQYGYYIYSQPISQQAVSARLERQAPLVQIAGKQAGAIHSSNVVVYVNP